MGGLSRRDGASPALGAIAVVTDIEWIRHAVNVFRFLLPGKVRVFPGGEVGAARHWIVASEP